MSTIAVSGILNSTSNACLRYSKPSPEYWVLVPGSKSKASLPVGWSQRQLTNPVWCASTWRVVNNLYRGSSFTSGSIQYLYRGSSSDQRPLLTNRNVVISTTGFVSEATWKIVLIGAWTPDFNSPNTCAVFSSLFSITPIPRASTLFFFMRAVSTLSAGKCITVWPKTADSNTVTTKKRK